MSMNAGPTLNISNLLDKHNGERRGSVAKIILSLRGNLKNDVPIRKIIKRNCKYETKLFGN